MRGTTVRKLDEVGLPMPRRIDDYIRAIAHSRNRAAHYMEGMTSEDALASLWQLSEVVRWYFETFLPAHDLARAAEKNRPGTTGQEEGLGLERQGQGQGRGVPRARRGRTVARGTPDDGTPSVGGTGEVKGRATAQAGTGTVGS
jgi:hypothetical protein